MRIQLSRLLITNRQREQAEMDAQKLSNLANSIEKLLLMHAPAVDLLTEEDLEKHGRDKYDFKLIAGGRRCCAFEMIFALGKGFMYAGEFYEKGEIPVVSVHELSPEDRFEAELDENLQREDLTWQKQASLISQLHEMRQKQKTAEYIATKDSDDRSPAPQQTIQDTLEELQNTIPVNYDTVRTSIQVASYLNDPDVKKAKTVRDAKKIIQAKEQRVANIALAEKHGKQMVMEKSKLFNEDCLKWLSETEEKFDVILSDPPYGIDAQNFSDGADRYRTITHGYDDSYPSWQKFMSDLIPLLSKVAKEAAHCYLFCDIERFTELKGFMSAAGWRVFRTPLVYIKQDSGRVPWPQHGPRRSTEYILYAVKGGKAITKIYPDYVMSRADDNLGHGAQKSIGALTDLLMRSVRPGEQVLDFCCGTGGIFVAAKTLNCVCYGLEQDPASYGIALQRLKSLQRGEEE